MSFQLTLKTVKSKSPIMQTVCLGITHYISVDIVTMPSYHIFSAVPFSDVCVATCIRVAHFQHLCYLLTYLLTYHFKCMCKVTITTASAHSLRTTKLHARGITIVRYFPNSSAENRPRSDPEHISNINYKDNRNHN